MQPVMTHEWAAIITEQNQADIIVLHCVTHYSRLGSLISTGMSEAKSWLWRKEESGMEHGKLFQSKQAAE